MPSKDRTSPRSISNSGEPFSGTAAGDAPATVEQTPRVCASRCVGYSISTSSGFGRVALRSCVAPPELAGQAAWQGSQRRLHPFLARWRRRRENPFPPQLRVRMEDVLQGWSPVGLGFVSQGLQVPFQGMCLHFAEDVVETKPSRCRNRWHVLTLGEPAGIVPLAFILLTRPFSVLRLVFGPSHCFYGSHLPGCLCPLSKSRTNWDPINKKSQQKHVS